MPSVDIPFEKECKKGQITSAFKFQIFAEQWLEEYARVNLRPTSYARMKQLTKRIYVAIGYKRMDKITDRDIQRFITDMMVNGKKINTGRPLSRKVAVHHLSFISDVFTYAVRMGMLCDNPCRRVFVPKQEQDEQTFKCGDKWVETDGPTPNGMVSLCRMVLRISGLVSSAKNTISHFMVCTASDTCFAVCLSSWCGYCNGIGRIRTLDGFYNEQYLLSYAGRSTG